MAESTQEQPRWLLRRLSSSLGLLPLVEPTTPNAQRLQCMEVWGGNRATESRLELSGLDAWVFCEPYEGPEGGDIHYISSCGSGDISRFVIADVAGHGSDASDLAMRLRGLMGKHLNLLNNARLAIALNREFAGLEATGRFATAVLATFFGPSHHLIVCNAGHPRPLWFNAAAGVWRPLEPNVPGQVADLGGISNLPLGVLEPTDYEQFAVKIGLGDAVVLYTDSMIEATAPDTDAELGEAGLLELVRGLRPADSPDLGRQILGAVAGYRGGQPAKDDQTLIVFQHNTAPPTPHGVLFRTAARLSKALGISDH
ncbi:MAG: PP2C family protein-serine/threonine phosphatase [Planctomycetota bacterium]|nr:PP2C family protein-serine/threonine phosphatase [Planctomycetota bacterium]